MDDLDRLYHHLVDTLRHEAPHLLRQRFTVGDLAQQLVPYRLHRRGLGFDAIQQYDQAMLRLMSGERGYLATEPVVQDAARQALSGPQPDLEPLRRFADAPAALLPDALRNLLGDLPPEGAPRSAGAPARTPTAPHPGVPPVPPPAPPTAPPPVAPMPPGPLAGAPGNASVPDRPPPPPRAPEPPFGAMPAAPSARPEPAAMPFPTRPPTPVLGGRCQYCGQALPEGRAVTFCPHCGQNVTLVRCPACSTELEAGWRFCVTCGRAMDGIPAGAPPTG